MRGIAAFLFGFAATPGLLTLVGIDTARANSLEVVPVELEMPAPAMSAVLTVINRGTRVSTVQIRTFSWSQDRDSDLLVRTQALFASPPIAEIAPGASQIFRVLLRQATSDREASYRLLLDELPSSDEPGQVKMALRISLPVFARPEGRTRADLKWQTLQSGPSGADIVAINRGTAAEKIIGLHLALDGTKPVEASALPNPWILPGTERHWHVVLPRPFESYGGTEARVTGHLRASSLDVAAQIVRAQ